MIPQSAASVLIRHVSVVSGGLDTYISYSSNLDNYHSEKQGTHIYSYI